MTATGYVKIESTDAQRRFPLSFAKVSAAEAFLTAGRRHFTCRHVMAGAGPVFCTDHPHIGPRCVLCLRDHILRHSDEEEYRCDECGQVVDTLRAIICSTMLSGVRLQVPRGRRGSFTGLVSFAAGGCCNDCWGPA